ncbi:MAG: hypothetical protein ACRD4F_13165, partial [Candidatus Angelobacter sp.]
MHSNLNIGAVIAADRLRLWFRLIRRVLKVIVESRDIGKWEEASRKKGSAKKRSWEKACAEKESFVEAMSKPEAIVAGEKAPAAMEKRVDGEP